MIVDDDDGVREALALALEDEGCHVSCARHGGEALAQLRSPGPVPCLIFLDLMMPVLDGRGFRAEQMKDERLSTIKVIVTTASDVPAEITGTRLLRKPFQFDRVMELLRGCPDHQLSDGGVRGSEARRTPRHSRSA
jgi:CheY-like chemotaxis protein